MDIFIIFVAVQVANPFNESYFFPVLLLFFLAELHNGSWETCQRLQFLPCIIRRFYIFLEKLVDLSNFCNASSWEFFFYIKELFNFFNIFKSKKFLELSECLAFFGVKSECLAFLFFFLLVKPECLAFVRSFSTGKSRANFLKKLYGACTNMSVYHADHFSSSKQNNHRDKYIINGFYKTMLKSLMWHMTIWYKI